jgi:hypothetical protein
MLAPSSLTYRLHPRDQASQLNAHDPIAGSVVAGQDVRCSPCGKRLIRRAPGQLRDERPATFQDLPGSSGRSENKTLDARAHAAGNEHAESSPQAHPAEVNGNRLGLRKRGPVTHPRGVPSQGRSSHRERVDLHELASEAVAPSDYPHAGDLAPRRRKRQHRLRLPELQTRAPGVGGGVARQHGRDETRNAKRYAANTHTNRFHRRCR